MNRDLTHLDEIDVFADSVGQSEYVKIDDFLMWFSPNDLSQRELQYVIVDRVRTTTTVVPESFSTCIIPKIHLKTTKHQHRHYKQQTNTFRGCKALPWSCFCGKIVTKPQKGLHCDNPTILFS